MNLFPGWYLLPFQPLHNPDLKWDKKPLEDHFDNNWALGNDLKKAGKLELWEKIKKISGQEKLVAFAIEFPPADAIRS